MRRDAEMNFLCKLSRWLFGVKWNRSEAMARMQEMVSTEEDNAVFLSNLAYQEAMRSVAGIPEGNSTQTARIADDLIVKLALIQMNKKASINAIKDEFEKLDRKMSRISRCCIARWLEGRSRRHLNRTRT